MAGRHERETLGVAVSLLGGPLIGGLGAVLESRALGRRAAVACARLALEAGRPVSREALADAVWGEMRPASWRPALRNVIAELRRALTAHGLAEDLALTASEGGYTLALPTGSTVDFVALRRDAEDAERALKEGDHAVASRLAGKSLAGASRAVLPGGHEEWVEGLRLELEDLRLRLERVAGESALGLGDPRRAERCARALIEAAPLREDGHRLLIGALRAAGNRAQALAAYDACRRLLADELGALPAPATQEPFLEILAEERAEHPGPHADARPVAPSRLLLVGERTPFVGRQTLLEHLRSRLDLVHSAGTFIITISGEPGLGKTRLAAELAAGAHDAGIAVLYGRADDRLSLPYAALLDALDPAIARFDMTQLEVELGEHLTVLATLLPSLRLPGTPPPVPGVAEPERILQPVVAALRLIAGAAGALLVLDDVQWASLAELDLLRSLIAEPDMARLVVLLLHRDPDGRGSLREVGRHPRVERLALEPLTARDVSELLRHVHRGPGDLEAQAASIWRRSGGNALLASELLRSSRLRDEHERPVRVGELVRERLAALPRAVEGALRLAAVAGLEFDPQLVATASSSDVAATESLETARRAGLLVPSMGNPSWLAFRHGLVRESLLEDLDPDELSRLHERLGSQLETTPANDPAGLVDLAYHFGAAGPLGDWRRALEYGLPVARAAHEAGVYEDVIALAARTLATLEQAGDPDPAARVDLEVLLGGAQRALGHPRGHETLAASFETARRLEDPVRMADAALAYSRAGALSEELYVDDGLLTLYGSALEALGPRDPHRRAQLLGRIASAYAWRQSAGASRRAVDEALSIARELGDVRTLAAVLTTARRSLAASSDLDTQERLDGELLVLAEQLDDPGLHVSASLWRFDTFVERGYGASLEPLLQTAGEHVRALRMGNYHHSLAYEHASLALLRGRIGEAEILVERAADIGRERGVDGTILEAIRLAQLVVVRNEQRRLAEFRDEAAAFFEPSGLTPWVGLVAFIDSAAGVTDGVADRLDAMIDAFASQGPTAICPVGLIAYMAASVARLADPDRARRLYELIVPFSGQGAYFACFAGPIDYHLGLLARILGDEPDARLRFAEAAAFCDRLGAPRWQARCQSSLEAAPEESVRH